MVNIIIYTIKRRWQYNGSTIEDKYYLYLVKSFNVVVYVDEKQVV